jgi:hypothetical protein
MRTIVSSIEAEWRRYKILADNTLLQVRDEELGLEGPGGGNSIAVIMAHLAGNLKSRFTDFLTADGEKPWRDRDSEFLARPGISRSEVMKVWNDGWETLFAALAPLADADLYRTVTIRRERFLVVEALHRLLPHASYHVGQIVYLAKAYRGKEWNCLTIPLGKSQEYNQNPTHEKPPSR